MAPIRLVTFDMTGTLLKFRTSVMEQYARAAAQHGVITQPNKIRDNFIASWKLLSKNHPNFGRETIGWQRWWKQIVIDSLEGSCSSENQKIQIAQHLIEHFETSNAYDVADDAHNVLQTLKQNGKILGVISNFDPRLHKIMNNLNLTHYFSFVLTSYEVGFLKPDKRIFELGLEKGGVASGEMVHVGNDKDLDYLGAKSAGMHAILVSGEAQTGDTISLENVVQCINLLN